MPENSTTRREFLRHGASLVALAGTVPAFLAQTVLAASRRGRARNLRDGERILVVLQLAGGNDGLSTVVPVTDDAYYRLRPRLAIPARDTLKLTDDFALAGAATGLKELFDTGHLAFVHAMGYPNPNRSHFKSMDIWHTASPDGRMHSGWLGRYFDNCCRGEDPCDSTCGVALMEESPLAMRGESFLPLAFERTAALKWHAAVRPASTGRAVTALNQPRPIDPPEPENNLEYLRRVALEARLSAEKIQWATRDQPHSRADAGRGGAIGRDLDTVARLIGAGMRTRVYYVSQTGYDTHADQANRHARLLRELGEALTSFFHTLKAQGDIQRVLVMSFSEFGRRVAENASQGTDHGAGGVGFLAGAAVKGGVHGPPPDLANLEHGDVRFRTDFRSLYATLLEDWLDVRHAPILGTPFPKLDLVSSRG